MMKKRTKGARILRRISVMLLAVLLMVGALNVSSMCVQVERLNVMLVIDGSGSLDTNRGVPTDPQGRRYEAIDLFLALLTNDGNNVGAIVFDHEIMMNSSIAPISGKSAKVALSNQIKSAKPRGGDTNTGDALLKAVDACTAATASNGLKSVIVLFSDGKIDMENHGAESAVKKSYEDLEQAVTKAQGANIPVHTICLNASASGNPAEMEELAARTQASCAVVKNAGDLTAAFENFYKVIFPNSTKETTNTTFGADGKLNMSIPVPSYGVEEVNVILNTQTVSGTGITSPAGPMTDAQIADSTMSGGFYNVVKLVDPVKGNWALDLSGVPGTNVTVNVLYNIDSTTQLKTSDGKNDYPVGATVTLQANLMQDGNVISDAAVTQEYTAKLSLVNTATGAETPIDMTPNANGVFTCTYTGSEYGSFTAKVTLSCNNLHLVSNEWPLNFGNTPPVAVTPEDTVKQTVIPFVGKDKTVDTASYFKDSDTVTYDIVSSQLVPGTFSIDTQTGIVTLLNDAKARSGDAVIEATDSFGAKSQMTLHVKVTQVGIIAFWTVVGIALAVIGAAIGFAIYQNTLLFKGKISVTSLSGGGQHSRFTFRGKLTLRELSCGDCGFVKGTFVVRPHNVVEFHSKTPLYTDMTARPDALGKKKEEKKILLRTGQNTIYSNVDRKNGIQVYLEPKR